MHPTFPSLHRMFVRVAVSVLLFLGNAATKGAEAPAVTWGAFLAGPYEGSSGVRVLANPMGGFYLLANGETRLVKFAADFSIEWALKIAPGTNDLRYVANLDVTESGDLLGLFSGEAGDHIFGQAISSQSSYVVQLRSQDGAPVFMRLINNCTVTALKARPGGGFYIAGYGSDTAKVGSDVIQIGIEGVFLSQITTKVDWTTFGRGASAAFSYAIQRIKTTGVGQGFRIFAAGSAFLPPFVFGGQTINQWAPYLFTLDGNGIVRSGQTLPADSTFWDLESRPSGGAHLFWEKQNTGSSYLKYVRRLDGEGAVVWEKQIDQWTSSIAAADNVCLVGSVGNADWFASSLDSNGDLQWTRGGPGRSTSAANDCTVLADGRMIVTGVASVSGIFADDIFLGDLSLVDSVPFGAFVAALETRSAASPAFREQPRDEKFVVQGETVTLHAAVFSPLPCTLQWFKNGVALAGKTSSDLVLANASSSNIGNYYLEARNSSGVTRSRSVDVMVNSISVSIFANTDALGLFDSPKNPVLLPNRSIIVSDPPRHLIRKADASGVTIFAGAGTQGMIQGAPAEAEFSFPSALAVDLRLGGFAKVYVADRGNNTIRRIRFSTSAGDASLVEETAMQLNGPTSLAATDGILDFIAGASGSSRVYRFHDGVPQQLAAQTQFGAIGGVQFDERGAVYIADSGNHQVFRIELDGTMTKLAGQGTSGFQDGAASLSTLNAPSGLALDGSGNLFVTEKGNHSVRKISRTGVTTKVAGLGSIGFQNGASSVALFNAPEGLCWRGNSLIVADTGNHCLREVQFIPLNDSTGSDPQITVTLGNSLGITVAASSSATFVIESSAQIGPNAQWQTEGTVTGGNAQGLTLLKPNTTRFYRARQTP